MLEGAHSPVTGQKNDGIEPDKTVSDAGAGASLHRPSRPPLLKAKGLQEVSPPPSNKFVTGPLPGHVCGQRWPLQRVTVYAFYRRVRH